jgi:hypothetical protein
MKSRKLELRSLHPKDEASFNNAIATFKNETPPFEFAFGFDKSIPWSANQILARASLQNPLIQGTLSCLLD